MQVKNKQRDSPYRKDGRGHKCQQFGVGAKHVMPLSDTRPKVTLMTIEMEMSMSVARHLPKRTGTHSVRKCRNDVRVALQRQPLPFAWCWCLHCREEGRSNFCSSRASLFTVLHGLLSVVLSSVWSALGRWERTGQLHELEMRCRVNSLVRISTK